MVQIQPRKVVLDRADSKAPTCQHELDHTDSTDHTDQEQIFPERSRSSTVVGIDCTDHLPDDLWNVWYFIF